LRIIHVLREYLPLYAHACNEPSSVCVCPEHLPKAHEGAHDLDADPSGACAPQNARQHGDTLLGECERQILPMTPAPVL
jgi:hypothetical protein